MTKAARLWKDAAAWEVRIAYRKQKPLKGRVAVLIMFYPKTRGRWDIDNRIKSCLDAITAGGVWQDDRQIDHLGVEVRAGQTQNPYTEVYVWELKKGMTT
jgi:Holliday junction resolvase RusA-like endonuclease